MCFMQVKTPREKKPKLSRAEQAKRTAELFSLVMNKTEAGKSIQRLLSYTRQESMFESMARDEIDNKRLGFK